MNSFLNILNTLGAKQSGLVQAWIDSHFQPHIEMGDKNSRVPFGDHRAMGTAIAAITEACTEIMGRCIRNNAANNTDSVYGNVIELDKKDRHQNICVLGQQYTTLSVSKFTDVEPIKPTGILFTDVRELMMDKGPHWEYSLLGSGFRVSPNTTYMSLSCEFYDPHEGQLIISSGSNLSDKEGNFQIYIPLTANTHKPRISQIKVSTSVGIDPDTGKAKEHLERRLEFADLRRMNEIVDSLTPWARSAAVALVYGDKKELIS